MPFICQLLYWERNLSIRSDICCTTTPELSTSLLMSSKRSHTEIVLHHHVIFISLGFWNRHFWRRTKIHLQKRLPQRWTLSINVKIQPNSNLYLKFRSKLCFANTNTYRMLMINFDIQETVCRTGKLKITCHEAVDPVNFNLFNLFYTNVCNIKFPITSSYIFKSQHWTARFADMYRGS